MKASFSLLTLLLQISNIRANNTCQWLNDGLGCVVQCLEGGSANTISDYVQTVYDEVPDCHSSGVKLILPKDVTDNTLQPNWLNVDINLIELEIDATFIEKFDRNLFASNVFAEVKTLHLKNIYDWSWYIPKTTFMGLYSLEHLQITNSVLKITDNGWLDDIKGTVKTLLLTGTGEEERLNIAKLTGGVVLTSIIFSNIEYVKIRYNITSVNYLSFTTIPNVRELDLSYCSLSSIGESSFEKLGSKLQLLNLEGNRLTTLPAGIFSSLHLSSCVPLLPPEDTEATNLVIRLSDNLWHCDCSMRHLKEMLVENENFVGEIVCSTPPEIMNYPINETVFCPSPVTTTTPESTTQPDNGNDNEKECSSYDDVHNKIKLAIQPQMQRIRLNRTLDEGVVSVNLEKYSNDLLLVCFKSETFTNGWEYHQNSNASADCFANVSNPIRINDLEADTSYTFCLMNISQTTVSPFDCISYYSEGQKKAQDDHFDAAWLYASSKPLIISLIVIACLANVVIGVIMGVIFLKRNGYETFTFGLVFHCWNEQKEAINPYSVGDLRTDLHERPPPLPPHPLRNLEVEESYYSTVK